LIVQQVSILSRILLLSLALSTASVNATDVCKVFVFLPNQPELLTHSELQKEPLKTCEFSVFTRMVDFIQRIELESPHYILTYARNTNHLAGYHWEETVTKDYKKTFYMIAAHKDEHEYVFTGNPRIGAVDILGREQTQGAIESLISAAITYRRVIKPEDLVSLLRFQMVDYIFVSDPVYRKVAEETNIALKKVREFQADFENISMGTLATIQEKETPVHQKIRKGLKLLGAVQ
jgi:hypothetical protein